MRHESRRAAQLRWAPSLQVTLPGAEDLPDDAKIAIDVSDLEVLICEELSGYELDGSGVLTMSHDQVGPLASRIARRAVVYQHLSESLNPV